MAAIPLSSIPTFASSRARAPSDAAARFLAAHRFVQPAPSAALAARVRLFRGDITRLAVDAVVNAAKASLLGGGGVDGAIHAAAGAGLRAECAALPLRDAPGANAPSGGRRARCHTGEAVVTSGHALPARLVVHTVGPICDVTGAATAGEAAALARCYAACAREAARAGAASVAFCCISTGIYGFPQALAAAIALREVRAAADAAVAAGTAPLDVVLCVFLERDQRLYKAFLPFFFPFSPADIAAAAAADAETDAAEAAGEGAAAAAAADEATDVAAAADGE